MGVKPTPNEKNLFQNYLCHIVRKGGFSKQWAQDEATPNYGLTPTLKLS
jgi:hypothetical protein